MTDIDNEARRQIAELRGAVRRTGEAFAEFAKEMPEMVIGFVEGLLP